MPLKFKHSCSSGRRDGVTAASQINTNEKEINCHVLYLYKVALQIRRKGDNKRLGAFCHMQNASIPKYLKLLVLLVDATFIRANINHTMRTVESIRDHDPTMTDFAKSINQGISLTQILQT